jgi:hypothetical protein
LDRPDVQVITYSIHQTLRKEVFCEVHRRIVRGCAFLLDVSWESGRVRLAVPQASA